MSTRPEYLTYRLEGMNLIEAAAGTGKTYTIQNLVVRFLLERQLPIRSLLVVTFTEAATAELRERIRTVLGEILRAAESGQATPESREALLLQKALEAGRSREECAELLRTALLGFDEAPISTIHGFCAKVLGENAFESGVLFRSELVKDVSKLVAEIGMDFYRRNFYRPGAEFAMALAGAAAITPENLLELAHRKLAHPNLIVRTPDAVADGPDRFLEKAGALYAELRECGLPEALETVAPYLNKLDTGPAADAPAAAAQLLSEKSTARSLRQLAGFGFSSLAPRIRKRIKGVSTETVLKLLDARPFRLADEFGETIRLYGIALKLAAMEYVEQEFRTRKSRDNILTFDDLLEQVHHALREPGSRLLSTLRERYPAGIVDEFQDTDPIQYEIFTSIFRRPGGTLYMVGDPRQAIYAFRGGDIATYRRAATELTSSGGKSYTLSTNYRSSAAMIEDVNCIFYQHKQPFADPAIQFPHVSARPGSSSNELLRNGVPEPNPLRILHVPGASEDECRALAARKVAELLNDRTLQLPGRTEPGVRPSDIAILVLNNYEAELLAKKLHALRIPAVSTRTGNVFASEDAGELLTVLRAASSGDMRELPNLLLTPLGGWTLEEVVELQNEPSGERLSAEQSRLQELQLIWEQGSFIEFFNALLSACRIRARYPALPRGERKLTNLLQLGDLLEQESARRGLTPAGVTEFLAERIASPEKADGEEFLQLLETDRESVTLMTIHSSKGLEFPIVLLPGLQLGNAEMRAELFHNSDGGLEYDMTGSDTAVQAAQNERLQELLRLAYVALTRAEYACFVIWGKGAKTSPLEWLFRMRQATGVTNPVTQLLTTFPDPDIPPELLDPEGISDSDPEEYRPAPDAEIELELLPTALRIDGNWQFVSYSSLSPKESGRDTPFDYDEREGEPVQPEEPPEGGIFSVRGGAAAGNAWHRLFELADFRADAEELRTLALPLLTDFGVIRAGEEPEEKLALTVEMVENVLFAPLSGEDQIRFQLRDVPKNERLAELEFSYRFRNGFTTDTLRERLAGYAAERFGLTEWPTWYRSISGGCLNGFIDLLFRHHGKYFILDWKSNRIGGRSSNFLPERLREEMAARFYFLQYMIYTVAVVKFLRMRTGKFEEAEYDAQFGGVFYLFLRGISPEHPGRGVFYDKPPYELVRQLEEVIG